MTVRQRRPLAVVLVCLVALVASPGAFAAQELTGNIQHALARPGQSLDGPWDVIIDPFETGYYNHRYEPNPNGWFRNRKPATPSDLVEYDFDLAPKLQVPGDWNSQDPQLFLYEGTLWYRKQFTVQPQAGQRYVLHFGAVNYRADVWVNGQPVGSHVGGFTPFDLEVTAVLVAGDNFVVVKADNQRRPDGVPTVNTDWWNYGGITRPVRLLELPANFIRDYVLQLDPQRPDQVRGWVQLAQALAGQEVEVVIAEAGIRETRSTGIDGIAHFSFKAPPQRWSPAQPKLYDVQLINGSERLSDRIGFRTIARRGEDILLNGQPVFLRGISIHEEKPGGGRASSRADAATLLGWAQALNANFVRLAHYPHNEHMLRLADELGLMVWSEIPVYWTVQFDNPQVLDNARNQLSEMITRDRNRAAVVLWSIANETPVSDERNGFLASLAATARELDPTRLITAALDTQTTEGDARLIADPLGDIVDVIGINSYCGWYSGTPESCAGLQWRSGFNKPVIMSEFGAGALAGLHGDAGQRWSEEYQSAVYANNIEMLRNMPFLRGAAPWILMDFRSPRRPLPGIQDFWNRKGLVSPQGERKQAFSLMQDYYSDVQQRWPDRP
jgi:beta-glucuronidase